jgi:hypothetical protein
MSLTLGKAKTLMKKIASNQGCSQGNIQTCNKSEEALEEVCALSTKIGILLNWLEQRAKYKMLLIPRIYVENIWRLISPNIKKTQILSSTILFHNNRNKDGGNNNNNGQLTKVST